MTGYETYNICFKWRAVKRTVEPFQYKDETLHIKYYVHFNDKRVEVQIFPKILLYK